MQMSNIQKFKVYKRAKKEQNHTVSDGNNREEPSANQMIALIAENIVYYHMQS